VGESNKMTFNKELLTKYVNLGWVIVPVGETNEPDPKDRKFKKPLKQWRNFNHLGEIVKPTADELWVDFTETYKSKVKGVGVITGTHSNLIVFDLDDYKETTNFDEIKKVMSEINTPIAKTGGGGFHIYFQFDENVKTKANLIKGLDTRGQGGFVVIPPSQHHSGNRYEWIKSPFDYPPVPVPNQLLELLPKKQNSFSPETNQQFQIFDFTKNYYQGERDETMFRVARSLIKLIPQKRHLNTALPLFIAWCKNHIVDNADGFVSDDNLIKKFQHALNYETAGDNISNISDFMSSDSILENLFRNERFGIPTGYKNFDANTGGILSSSLTLLSAQTGIGKSLMFMNFLNNISKDKKVAYFDLENGVLETIERIVRIKYGLPKSFFHDPANAPIVKKYATEIENYRYLPTSAKIRDFKVLKDKVKEFADDGVELFVIDPLQKIDGGDDIKQVGKIVGELSDLSKEYNVAVLLCHHVKKAPNSGGKYVSKVNDAKEHNFLDPNIEDVKGGGIITDTAENVWMMFRNVMATDYLERARVGLRIHKCRSNGNAIGLYGFVLDLNTLQVYDDESKLTFNLKGTMYDAYMKG
jgi:archaellum biogenesis ATPase FlaH